MHSFDSWGRLPLITEGRDPLILQVGVIHLYMYQQHKRKGEKENSTAEA